jgi:hypothetical protein
MSNFAFDRIQFGEILSHDTAYGIIWNGTFDQKTVVIKMIMLTSGIHYDKDKDRYFDGKGRHLSTEDAEVHMSHDDPKPWYHTLFKRRRSMTPDAFLTEVDNMLYLNRYQLSPQVFCYGIFDQTRNHLHYGFIVMEKLDCTIKNIFLRRGLTEVEMALVKEAINQLHCSANVVHLDMKPSNIGCNLKDNLITQVKFIDLQKMKYQHKSDPTEFTKLIERDNLTFDHHTVKNKTVDRDKNDKKKKKKTRR